jgi:PST family polysaccharide transporter
VQSKYTVWVQNSVFAVFATLKGVMILQGASIFAFVWAMLCEAAAVALILLFVMNLRGPRLARLAFSFAQAKKLLKDSWPLFLSAAAITVYVKIDQIMLGQMIGDESVGIYGAAVRLSEAWYCIPVVIVSSLLPTILDAQKRSKELYYEKIQYLYDLMVIISISAALPMTFLATPLIRILFGSDYSEAGMVLAIHMWATLFVSLGVASSTWFLAENRLMLSLQRTLLGAVANVALNLLLIPDYGLVGAAVALVISQALASLFFDVLHRETHKMFLMKLSSLNPFAVYKRWCLTKW